MGLSVHFKYGIGEEVKYTILESRRVKCGACGGLGWFRGALDGLMHDCSRCHGDGDVTTGEIVDASYRGKVDGIKCHNEVGSPVVHRYYRIGEGDGFRWVEEESVESLDY